MDPLRIHAYKIHAIKKHRRQKFVGTLVLYSLSTLACTLFCSSPLWYSPFCATFNVVFFFSLPNICSFFFTSKVLFVVGNLIVIFLVGQSKFFTSKSMDNSGVTYNSDVSNRDHKYACKSPKPQVLSAVVAKCSSESWSNDEEKKVVRFVEDLKRKEEEEEEILPAEELNKLADDFIARINRQRRLEVEVSGKWRGG